MKLAASFYGACGPLLLWWRPQSANANPLGAICGRRKCQADGLSQQEMVGFSGICQNFRNPKSARRMEISIFGSSLGA